MWMNPNRPDKLGKVATLRWVRGPDWGPSCWVTWHGWGNPDAYNGPWFLASFTRLSDLELQVLDYIREATCSR